MDILARLRGFFAPAPDTAVLAAALNEAKRRELEAKKQAGLLGVIKTMMQDMVMARALDNSGREAYIERCHELYEARQMAGSGPWLTESDRGRLNSPGAKLLGVRESLPINASGSFGDLELALQNAEWRREVNFSWLEFSRWGIQQIILISRLYYIKNPIIRRLIDVDAYYVFGRGVEVSSPDQDANEVLQEFFERNNAVLGQVALSELQKRTNYDGNLFFCFFADTDDTGNVSVRLIDATEMQDIVTDPDDVTQEQYFRRSWSQRVFDATSGVTRVGTIERWYPALGYDPPVKPEMINMIPVDWEHPVFHRKYGAVGQWVFGCPIIYPALDWAKAARKFLEACATVKQALSQIALTITTKGGQQVLEGIKQQLQTTAGAGSQLFDTNPTPVNASIFASGPGTVLQAFQTKGAGGDPAEVKQFVNMACMVIGVPPTFLGDLETANLATATTLDRPTELGFNHKQEAWKEVLVTIGAYVLSVSSRAPSGKLREGVTMREARKIRKADGTTVYIEATGSQDAKTVEVKCTFPAIREGDQAQLMTALVQAVTLGNSQGEAVGIDLKATVRRAYEILGIEEADELTEEAFPEASYDPDRVEELNAAKKLALNPPAPVVATPAPGAKPTPPAVKEAALRVVEALREFAA